MINPKSPAAKTDPITDRPTFIVHLRPKSGIDPIKALRGALKVLWRRFGLRATAVEERRP